MPLPPLTTNSRPYRAPLLTLPASAALKRPRAASAPCENEEARQRKRSKSNTDIGFMNDTIHEDTVDETPVDVSAAIHKSKGKEKESLSPATSQVFEGITAAVIEELAQELKCGCCTELCYNPVIVNPCQHYFCGSCCILWVRNGGTNCPACRGVSLSVTPSRVLQSMIDLLLRSDPSRARTANERAQADQVYKMGTSLRLPTPRPVTPEPNLEPPNDSFARPCPTCLPGNTYGWRCPIPIQDPAVDPENAFDLDDGTPPGHAFCGNCDQLHNLQAPTSTKCDFCQVSFCGVGIQGRCCALGLLSQQPHGMSELPDIILCGAIYDSFHGNFVEVDILVDYLRTNDITLRAVYKEIVTYMLQQPHSFMSLIDSGIFDDLHGVAGGDDPDPTAPRRRICRLCAAQLLIHGMKDWWIRERRHGNLPNDVVMRKDCSNGCGCDKQSDPTHCKEFNHVIAPAGELSADHPPPSSAPTTMNAISSLIARVPASAASHPLGLFFQQPNMDLPPPSPPTLTPRNDVSFNQLMSSHQPAWRNGHGAVADSNMDVSGGSGGGPRSIGPHLSGLQANGQAASNRATNTQYDNGEPSSSAMMSVLSSGPPISNTMTVAANYGES